MLRRISVSTHGQKLYEITREVDAVVRAARISEGLATVFCRHTSCSLIINENADPDVKHDLLKKLEALIPKIEGYYQHAEGNSDSHLKTSLVGNSVTVLIDKGKLVLGTWQGIQFCEFDGPRTRNYLVKIVSFDGAKE